MGIDFAGFFASSDVVAITSNPINAKKHDAEPAIIPFTPKGANGFQLSRSAYIIPTTTTAIIVSKLIATHKLFKRAEFLIPNETNIEKSKTIQNANTSTYTLSPGA